MFVKKIYTVFDKVLNIDPSVDIKRFLKSVLSGYDVEGDIKYIRNYMSLLNDSEERECKL